MRLAGDQGANVKVVQRLLGHKRAVLTRWTATGICSPTTWTPLRPPSTRLRKLVRAIGKLTVAAPAGNTL